MSRSEYNSKRTAYSRAESKGSTKYALSKYSESYLSTVYSKNSAFNARTGKKTRKFEEWIDQIESFYSENCADDFMFQAAHYAKLRRRMGKTRSFAYAKSFTQWDTIERSKFFSRLSLLVEKKVNYGERVAILVFLAELSAIETPEPAFGYQALQTFVELVLSLSNIKSVLMEVIKKTLAEVTCQMSLKHLMKVIPLLDKILRHPKFGATSLSSLADYHPIRSNKDQKGESKTSECAFAHQLNLVHEKKLQEMVDNERNGPVKQAVLRFMALCAQNEKIAASFYREMEGVSDQDTDEKESSRKSKAGGVLIKELLKTAPQDEIVLLVHAAKIELRANIAKSFWEMVKEKKTYTAANNFRAGKALNSMIAALEKQVGDEKATSSHQVAYQAALVSCIGAIWRRSEKTAKPETKIRKAKNPFISMFLRLARRTTNGTLISACLDLVFNVIIRYRDENEKTTLGSYRDVLETQVGLAFILQNIVKNLMASMRTKQSRTTPEEQAALKLAVDIMHFYNEHSRSEVETKEKLRTQATNLSHKFNDAEVKGYDREEINFKILETQMDGTFSGEVRLSAARCISTVPLTQFDAEEIRRVVTILSNMSTGNSENVYEILTHIIFLMVRLATSKKEEAREIRKTFLTIYAAEVVSTVFELLARCSGKEVSASDVKGVEVAQRSCLTACVKFLMIAWERLEFRDGIFSEANQAIFCRILKVEQALLKFADASMFSHHNHVLIEQTYIGSDVKTLLSGLDSLIDRDIVAFRIYHQLANVIGNNFLHKEPIQKFDADKGKPLGNPEYLVRNLTDEAMLGFDKWNSYRCGTGISDLKFLEALPLIDGTTHQGYKVELVPENDQSVVDAIARLIFHYVRDVYQIRTDNVASINAMDMSSKIKEWIEDAHNPRTRVQTLIVRNPENPKEISAFVHGGPIKKNQAAKYQTDRQKIHENLCGDSKIFTKKGFCEVYHFYVDPQGDDVAIAQALLSDFSHRMYERHFSKCMIWIHGEERGFFQTDSTGDVIRGEKIKHPSLKPRHVKQRLLKIKQENEDSAKKTDERKFNPENGEGDIMNEYLRIWDLKNNVWQSNDSHTTFLKNKGVQRMASFLSLSRDGLDSKSLRSFSTSSSVTSRSKFSSRVRKALESEDFGTELIMLLRKGTSSKLAKSERMEVKSNRKFGSLVTKALINDLYVDIRVKSSGQQSWSLFLNGTPSEKLVCINSITPFPSPPPLPGHSLEIANPHASHVHYFHTQQKTLSKPIKPWLNEPVLLLSNIPAKKDAYSEEINKRNANWEEQVAEQKLKKSRAERVRTNMQMQFHAMSASFIRLLYVLMTRSSKSTRQSTEDLLRDPKLFKELRKVLESFDYEIDFSVSSRLPHKFNVANKFLLLCLTLTDISPVGHKECLQTLEFYEVIADCIKDILQRMKRLIDSRDFDNAHAPNSTKTKREGRLNAQDETLLSTVCAAMENVISEVLQLGFFNGKRPEIHQGNLKCRRKAIQALFLHDSAIENALMSVLRYDSEVNESLKDSKKNIANASINVDWNSKCQPLDWARIRILSILSSLMDSSEKFSYRFLREFAGGNVKANVGMRQSFVRDLLRSNGRITLRAELESNMNQDGLLDDDEVLEYVTFVEVKGVTKLMICGNEKRFLLSNDKVPASVPQRITREYVLSTLMEKKTLWRTLDSIPYPTVKGVYRGKGDQLFAVTYKKDDSDADKESENCLVFYVPIYGEAKRLVEVFKRYCRDDLDHPMIDPLPNDVLGEGNQDSDKDEDEDEDKDDEGSEIEDTKDPHSTKRHIDFSHSTFFEDALEDMLLSSDAKRNGLEISPEEAKRYKDCLWTYAVVENKRRLLIWIHADRTNIIILCDSNDALWTPQDPEELEENAPNFLKYWKHIDLKDVCGYEYPGGQQPVVHIAYGKEYESPKEITVTFGCDTAREMWRRELLRYRSMLSNQSERKFDHFVSDKGLRRAELDPETDIKEDTRKRFV
mmetsp:Transcript_14578/g.22120  ORF Transcript_14578/g.22120 Transcript_14578/m.22120 type:complete len:1974 (+) Transcript_14578:73-5994(+)